VTDPVAAGMRAQLARRAERVTEGDGAIGWKLGFNAPATQEQLGIDRSLTGFVLRSGVLATGSTHRLDGRAVLAEAEVAVELGRDVAAGTSPEQALGAVVALLPALELVESVDLSLPLDAILAGNVFHRAVCFGPRVQASAPGAGTLLVNGERRASLDHAATSAHLGEAVAFCADRLAEAGAKLSAGDRLLTGTLAPPAAVSAGDRVRLELERLGAVELAFS